MFSFKNPIVLFVFTWVTVVILYNMRLSFLLEKLNLLSGIYLTLVIFSLILSFFVVLFIFRNFRYFKFAQHIIINKKTTPRIIVLLIIWFSFSAFEIFYFRGVPLLAFFTGAEMRYTEWGIPSLHGVLNAIILTISNYALFNILKLKENRKRFILLYILCFMWPILLVTRQLFMSMGIQSLFVYFFLERVDKKVILRSLLLILTIVIVFGIVGDLRTGASSFIDLVQPTDAFPTWLPSGFLWVYIYITSPFNNVNFNINRFESLNFDLEPVVSQLIPSFIRTKIFGESGMQIELVNENLNVSTLFPNYLHAFGFWGSIFFFFILGCIMSVIYLKTLSKNVHIAWIMIMVVILHNVIFSLFVDFFTSLVFVFQILLHASFLIKIKND
jgi:oligosaccharide repeat unit polymerase